MIDMHVLDYLKVGDFVLPSNFAKYKVTNAFETKKQIRTLSNGEDSVDNVTGYYRPMAEITLGECSISEYRAFIRQINKMKFTCEYYDYELGIKVNRTMRMTKHDIDRLYGYMDNIVGVRGLSVSFRSIYAYENYDALTKGEHL